MKSARVRKVPEELKFFRSTRKREVKEKGFKRNKDKMQKKKRCERKKMQKKRKMDLMIIIFIMMAYWINVGSRSQQSLSRHKKL